MNAYKPLQNADGSWRCQAGVYEREWWGKWHQCHRKAAVEEDGARWCKQHAPSAEKARRQKAHEQYKAKWNAERPRWYAGKMMAIIEQIAAGHNDPSGLCADFLKDYRKDAS